MKEIKWSEYHVINNIPSVVCILIMDDNSILVGQFSARNMKEFQLDLAKEYAFNDAESKNRKTTLYSVNQRQVI
jgi:hypothetical protein